MMILSNKNNFHYEFLLKNVNKSNSFENLIQNAMNLKNDSLLFDLNLNQNLNKLPNVADHLILDNLNQNKTLFNCTNILNSYLKDPFIIISLITMITINLIVVFGNVLVIISVILYSKLRTITNFFIFSLAVADLLLGITVLPYSLTQIISRTWYFGEFWCLGWLVIDVWLSTASILNLVAISVDRYLAITRPIKYRSLMTAKRAKLIIAFTWILSFLICFPPLVSWNQRASGLIKVNLIQEFKIQTNSINAFNQITTKNNSNKSLFTRSFKASLINSHHYFHSINLYHSLNYFLQIAKKFDFNKMIEEQHKRNHYSIATQFNKNNSNLPIFDKFTSIDKNSNKNKINLLNNTLVSKQKLFYLKPNLKNLYLNQEMNIYSKNQKFVQSDNINYLQKKANKKSKNKSSNLINSLELIKNLNNSNNCTKNQIILLHCTLFDSKGYVIYSALGSFYIPMLIMIFFYWRIYLVAMHTTRALNRGYINKIKNNINCTINIYEKNNSSNSNIALNIKENNLNNTNNLTNNTNLEKNNNSNRSCSSNWLSNEFELYENDSTLRIHKGYICKDLRKEQEFSEYEFNSKHINHNLTKKNLYKLKNNFNRKLNKNNQVLNENDFNYNINIKNVLIFLKTILFHPTKLKKKYQERQKNKQLKKIQIRSVRLLSRTNNIINLVQQNKAQKKNFIKSEHNSILNKTKYNLECRQKIEIEEKIDEKQNSNKMQHENCSIKYCTNNTNECNFEQINEIKCNKLNKSKSIESINKNFAKKDKLNENMLKGKNLNRFSKKKRKCMKIYNQNNSGKFQAKRFIAETKAAKTVGIIVGGFICCWFPFFTVYLTRGFCNDKNCIPDLLLTIFVWLGYINSALNPFIYGMFSKEFRKAFKNILCKCKFSEETGVKSLIRQIHLANLFEENII